ncbi:TniQ family protein [Pseudoduganella rivuli]|uniref:TniQ family protein n=1 Tax=Pseudoduganella rivuli TaxID=2666085 RepID=UPI0012AFBDF7|nr:TniQ family protein [Pseudoduganella rivuli]
MLLPSPLPDEIHSGYWGRIIRINGFRDEVTALYYVSAKLLAQHSNDTKPYLLEVLATAGNMPLQDFARKHTLMPYRRAIASYKPELIHGDPDDRSMIRMSGTRLARPGAYFCSACIEDDWRKYGMSYWKRKHQLPGMYTCPMHATALQYVKDDSAFIEAPARCISSSHTVDPGWARSQHDHADVQNFLQLSVALASSSQPLDLRPVRALLREKARAFGIASHPKSTAKNKLSDLIASRFPKQWLEAVFPPVLAKRQGQIFTQLDGVLYCSTCSSSIVAYLLGISVLFCSADQALEIFQSDFSASLPSVARRRRQLKKTLPDAKTIIDHYIRSRGNHPQMAREFGVSLSTIKAHLYSMGLPNLRRRGDKEQRVYVAAKNFYVHEMSLVESAENANVEIAELERVLRVAGANFSTVLTEMEPSTSMTMRLRGAVNNTYLRAPE